MDTSSQSRHPAPSGAEPPATAVPDERRDPQDADGRDDPDAGTDPGAQWVGLLHRAAENGSPESVRELARRVADVDRPDEWGETALWKAVCHGAEANVVELLAAGADAWTPRMGRWSPGRLALTTRLAPLFAAGAPEHARLTEAERAAFAAADGQAAAFGDDLYTEGISVAFLSGVTLPEAMVRLGADPDDPGPTAYDPYDDWDHSSRFVAATAVPGGCALLQPTYYGLYTDTWLAALTDGGGRAYGLYFNPKGGVFGTLAENGVPLHGEEIGLPPLDADVPAGHWTHRFWLWDRPARRWNNNELAYACHQAGITVPDARPITGPPDRWIEIPEDSALADA
ncbi:ankyrin repeat domain-containing protein [Streptomyces luteireticuli]|uniref:Ankyrin repeat domain-containing protein n=1 Tax=Streptomyces luteireticuli TaxID=173858 RepID=A0ABN0YH11_9ACTN